MNVDELIEMKKSIQDRVYAIYSDFGNIDTLTTQEEIEKKVDTVGALKYIEKSIEVLTMVYSSLGYTFNDLSVLIEFNPILKASFYKGISDHYNPDDSYEETDSFMDYLLNIGTDNIKQNMLGDIVKVSLKQRPSCFDENIVDGDNEFYQHNMSLNSESRNNSDMRVLNETLDRQLPGDGVFYVEYAKFVEGLKSLGYNVSFSEIRNNSDSNIDEVIVPMIYSSFCSDEATNVMSVNVSFEKEQEHDQK